MKTALIMPAAGSGSRLGAVTQKALVKVHGAAIVRHALDAFRAVDHVVEAVVLAPPGALPEIREALAGIAWPGCILRVAAGGETRQQSVKAGLDVIESDVSLACVHDAARPLVTSRTILRVLAAAAEHGAATAASRPVDSMRLEDDDGRPVPIDRDKAWLVETPQAFRWDLLYKAHEHAAATRMSVTDDASLVEACGSAPVSMVESEGPNFKVTRPEDLDRAERLLARRD